MIDGRAIAPDRIGCLVPGCGRTFKRTDNAAEVVCGKHYRLAPRSMRDDLTRFRRLWRRLDRRGRYTEAVGLRCDRQWEHLRSTILTIAAGNIDDRDLAQFVEAL